MWKSFVKLFGIRLFGFEMFKATIGIWLIIFGIIGTMLCTIIPNSFALPGLSSIEAYNNKTTKWKITAYCACPKCCGKYSDGHFASGKKVYVGGVACNWLPFGTKIKIEGMGDFTVEDRGAESLFGSKDNKIKHLDIYFPSHSEAKQFGVKYRKVTIGG